MKLFRKTKLNQKGFGHLELIVAVVVIAAVAAIGIKVLKGSHADSISEILISSPSASSLYTSNGSQASTVLFNAGQNPANFGSATWVSNASAIDYQNNGGVYTVNSSGQNPTNISVSGFKYTSISYSEAAGELAYTGCVTATNSCGLYTSTAMGASPKLILTLPGTSQWYNNSISWSPNGKNIEAGYFNVVNNMTSDYAVVYSSTGKIISEFLTTYPASTYCDSSEGNQWATSTELICKAVNSEGLLEVNDKDTVVTTIPHIAVTNNVNSVSNYAVSPDGKKIAYSTQTFSNSPSVCKVYTIDTSGKNNALVYTGSGQSCGELDWSPSSASIVFAAYGITGSSSNGTGNIYTLNVPSTGSTVSIYGWTNGASPASVEWSTQ